MSATTEVASGLRRWQRRVLLGLAVFVGVCVLAAAGGYGYIRYRLHQLHHVRIPGIRHEDPGQPENVLVVGSDTRAQLEPDQAQFGARGDVSGQRSDVTMVLHIDPEQKKASILSIPRDTYVPIAGTTRSDRINTAFANGPGQLIQTIQEDFGITINHYVEVNFDGFRGIVNALGGVNVYFPAPARDAFSGLRITDAGCVHLNGDSALAYVRSRHYQYFESGRWRIDPNGDLSRIQRQQDLIRRILRDVAGTRNPFTLNALIGSTVHQVTVDTGLSAGDILRLARRFHSLSPDAVNSYTLPTVPAVVGGADVLRLKQPEAQATLDALLNKPSPQATAGSAMLPSAVRVRVLNGTGRGGEAGSVASALARDGFNVAGTGDADAFRYTAPLIRYGAGQQAKAVLLQSVLTGRAQLVSDATLRGVDLVLVTGRDLGPIKSIAPAAIPTTTTPSPVPNPTGTPANRGAPLQPQC